MYSPYPFRHKIKNECRELTGFPEEKSMQSESDPDKQQDEASNPEPSTGEDGPTAGSCRTRPITPDFSDCLLKRASCKYALRFGYGYFCTHHKHREFAAVAPDTESDPPKK
jgi:hypothetical protein